jgi:hypothetical protein
MCVSNLQRKEWCMKVFAFVVVEIESGRFEGK